MEQKVRFYQCESRKIKLLTTMEEGTSYGVIEVKSAEAGKVSLVFYSDIAATHKVGAATLTDTENLY
jgi:hypothetical protein